MQDKAFYKKRTINCGGKLLFLDEPLIMGILNITPDSFFAASRAEADLLKICEKMLSVGADIIDIGGYSTRPGAAEVGEQEELKRVVPAIKKLAEHFPDAVISIDTFRSNVAREAINAGATIINDISGGSFDENMFECVAELNVPYILMHLKGTLQTMHEKTAYEDVTDDVSFYFSEKLSRLKKAGVHDVILDPGFGFSKKVEDNYQLLKQLDQLKIFELPVLAGISRKSMINQIAGTKPETALSATTAANTIALMHGADILRVHDIKEAKEAVKIVGYTEKF